MRPHSTRALRSLCVHVGLLLGRADLGLVAHQPGLVPGKEEAPPVSVEWMGEELAVGAAGRGAGSAASVVVALGRGLLAPSSLKWGQGASLTGWPRRGSGKLLARMPRMPRMPARRGAAGAWRSAASQPVFLFSDTAGRKPLSQDAHLILTGRLLFPLGRLLTWPPARRLSPGSASQRHRAGFVTRGLTGAFEPLLLGGPCSQRSDPRS